MPRARTVAGALQACVIPRSETAIERALAYVEAHGELSQFLTAAGYNGVVGFVHAAVAGTNLLPPRAREAVAHQHRIQVVHHLRVLAALEQFQAVAAREEIEFICFKGPVLAESLYGQPDLRCYTDLDLAVPRRGFPAMVRALKSEGFALLDQNWDLIRRAGRSQVHFVLGLDVRVDLHWHLLNDAKDRNSMPMSMSDLFGRARLVGLAGIDVSTLDPADTLVHVCLHAALAGRQRLIWLKDIERAIAVDAPPWDLVVDRARAWHVCLPVAISLGRARRALQAQVPDEVMGALAGSSCRRMVSDLLDRLSSPTGSDHSVSPAALWAEVARDSRRAMGRALLDRITRPIPRYLRLRPAPTGRLPLDIMVPSASAGGLDAYLADLDRSTTSGGEKPDKSR